MILSKTLSADYGGFFHIESMKIRALSVTSQPTRNSYRSPRFYGSYLKSVILTLEALSPPFSPVYQPLVLTGHDEFVGAHLGYFEKQRGNIDW